MMKVDWTCPYMFKSNAPLTVFTPHKSELHNPEEYHLRYSNWAKVNSWPLSALPLEFIYKTLSKVIMTQQVRLYRAWHGSQSFLMCSSGSVQGLPSHVCLSVCGSVSVSITFISVVATCPVSLWVSHLLLFQCFIHIGNPRERGRKREIEHIQCVSQKGMRLICDWVTM